MKWLLRIEGGLGKNFALLPSLRILSEKTTPKEIGLVAHYQQVYNYMPFRQYFEFYYNWNYIIPSPYDIHKNFDIYVIEPYSGDFFVSGKHITYAFGEEIWKVLGIDELLDISPDDFFDWTFDDSRIAKRLKWLDEFLSERPVVVIEAQNRRKDEGDPRSLTVNQTVTIINELVKAGYNVVVVSSYPYLVFQNNSSPYPMTYYYDNFIRGYGTPRIFYIHDVLELAYILRRYATAFLSIDSFLPYLAHTKYVRENKQLKGVVFFFATHPNNFGFPENANILYNPTPSSRTFGLGGWDGYFPLPDIQIRNTISPDTLLKHANIL